MTFVGVHDHYSFRVRQAEQAAAAARRAKLDAEAAAAAAAAAADHLFRWMEAGGVDGAQQPLLQAKPTLPTPGISPGTWRILRIFLRCFGVMASIVLVAWTLMTTRHGPLDRYEKAGLVVLDLSIAAMAFAFTPKELDKA
ncbi:hypothetical protein ACP70R_038809 [Stipagrostis hirtigluma subsp. patula]